MPGTPADNSIISRAGIAGILIVLVAIILYWPSAVILGQMWRDGAAVLNHGYPVAFISAILLVRDARTAPASMVSPSWAGLALLILASLGWLLAIVAQVVAVHTVLLPLIVLAAVYSALGRRMAVRLAFPILFVVVALPFWLDVQALLQVLTTWIATLILALLGIPVLVEGDLVHVTAGTFRIAYGCGGANFLVVSLTLAALYGHLASFGIKDRIKLIGAATLLALAANWIRVASIIYIGNATDMQSSLVNSHVTYGWILYAASLVPFCLYALHLSRIAIKRHAIVAIGSSSPQTQSDRRMLAPIAASILGLAAAPTWAYVATQKYPESAVAEIILPQAPSGWSGPEPVDRPPWRPRFHGISGEALGRYLTDNGPVWMYANVYLAERQGAELIHYENSIAGDLTARINTPLLIRDSAGKPTNVRQIETDDNGRHWLIWYWYDIAGTRETRDVNAKMQQALATLLGNPESGITAIATTCVGKCNIARDRLQRFVSDGGASITWQNDN